MGVLPGSASLKSKLPSGKKPRLLLLVLLVLALVAGAWWYRESNKPTATRQQTAEALDAAGTADSDQAAIATLKAAYADAATNEGKAQAAYYLAARYTVIDDHANALKYFREADKLGEGKSIDVILGVAAEADALKEKALAREYYQKAIDHYRPLIVEDETLQTLVLRFEAKIDENK